MVTSSFLPRKANWVHLAGPRAEECSRICVEEETVAQYGDTVYSDFDWLKQAKPHAFYIFYDNEVMICAFECCHD